MPYIGKKPENIIATAVDSTTGDFSGNVTAGGTLAVTGETTLATHLNLGDSDKIKLGAAGDLEVYHDGSNSYIDDTGTGNLRIRANDQIKLQKYNKISTSSLGCGYNSNEFSAYTSRFNISVSSLHFLFIMAERRQGCEISIFYFFSTCNYISNSIHGYVVLV